MENCTHFQGINPTKQLQKLTNPLLKDSITSDSLFCEKCSVGLPNIWLCLHDSCNFKGCGRYQNKHAQQHFTRSKHSIFMNPKTTLIWCLDCDTEVLDINSLSIKSVFSNPAPKVEVKIKGTRGVVGLKNLGNTCFMNSSMQCLSNIRSIQRYFSKILQFQEVRQSKSESAEMISNLAALFQSMWSGESSQTTPKPFWDSFRQIAPFFKGNSQHDSQEFLRLFLDRLNEDLKFEYKPGSFRSIISDTFKSSIQNKITCSKCGNSSTSEEDYYDFSISIPTPEEIESYKVYSKEVMSPQERVSFFSERQSMWNKIQQIFAEGKNTVSVYDCLLNFCLPEELKQKFNCERCGKKTLSRREVKILKSPNTLMLVIKRFKYNKAGVKIGTYVQFPATIDLRFFLQKNVSCQYQLTGMIQHIGGVNGGHYVAYCKNYKTNNWHEFDDTRTRQITQQQLLEKEAYILFYQKQITEQREKYRKGNKNALIPSYWSNLYYTLEEPGLIYQKYLICQHGNLKPIYALSQFTSVSVSQDTELREKFKSDGKQILNIEQCATCLVNFHNFSLRAEKELEIINELNSIELFEGPWYLISSKWLKHWKEFCALEAASSSVPSAVNNIELLDMGKAKEGLEVGKDYRGVNRHVWAAFMMLYKGGPEIKRMEVDIYKDPALEIACSTPDLNEEQIFRLKEILNTYNIS